MGRSKVNFVYLNGLGVETRDGVSIYMIMMTTPDDLSLRTIRDLILGAACQMYKLTKVNTNTRFYIHNIDYCA